MDYSSMAPLPAFFKMIFDFFAGIIDKLNSAHIVYDSTGNYTTLGDILFAAIIIGFVVSLFWRGAKTG